MEINKFIKDNELIIYDKCIDWKDLRIVFFAFANLCNTHEEKILLCDYLIDCINKHHKAH